MTIITTPPPTPPAPTLLPADDSGIVGDGITNDNKPAFVGTAVANTTVTLESTGGLVIGSATVAANGSYTVQATSKLADGTYSLVLTDADVAGNVSKQSPVFTLVIDTTAPAAPTTPKLLASDDSGVLGDGITNVRQPHLTGTATAGVTVQLLNSSGTVLGSAVAAASGAYSVQPASPLANGLYILSTRAVDLAGNISPSSGGLSLTILNTTPATPAVPTLSAANNIGTSTSPKSMSRQPAIQGTATAGDTVRLLNASGTVLATTTAGASTGSYTLPPTSNLPIGVNALRVQQVDVAGNVSAASTAVSVTIVNTAQADFNGDGKTDMAVYQASTGQWTINNSTSGVVTSVQFGTPKYVDIPVPGDYDGVGHSEYAVYRPSTGQWLIDSASGTRVVNFGEPGVDIPVPGDYDGVGYTEPAVFRPTTGQWFVLGPTGGRLLGTFGATNLVDLPVPGDYDHVGHTEIAVFRPSTGQWFVDGPNGGHLLTTFGGTNFLDIPVPGDYGDVGYTEPAVFRPSTGQWFVDGPNGGYYLSAFGATNYAQVPVDAPIYALYKLGLLTGSKAAVVKADAVAVGVSSPSQSAPLTVAPTPSTSTAPPSAERRSRRSGSDAKAARSAELPRHSGPRGREPLW